MPKLSRKLSTKLSRKLSIDLADNAPPIVLLNRLVALSALNAVNFYQTANLGGESGAASGFGFVELVAIDKLGTARVIGSRSNSAYTAGYAFALSAANVLTFAAASGAGAAVNSPSYTLQPSDMGRVLCLIGWHDGTKLRLMVSRVQTADGTAITGFTPAAARTSISGDAVSNASPAVDVRYFGGLTFTGTPTVAQLQVLSDVMRPGADPPPTMVGATVTHRWSPQVPAGVPAVNRTSYGARGWNKPCYWDTASSATAGVVGSASGFVAQARIRIDGKAAAQTGYVMARGNATSQGYIVDLGGGVISGRAGNGSAYAATPNYTLADNDLGRVVILSLVYDQPAALLRLYLNDLQISSVALAVFVPLAGALPSRFGAFSAGASGGDGWTAFQASGGNIIPSVADLRAQALASEAAGKLVPLAGANHLWNWDAAIKTAGGAAVAMVPDSIGTDTITRNGTMEVGVLIETAPAAPATVPDSTTGAAGDALARVGSPVLRLVDPLVDGRQRYALTNLSLANGYATGILKGIIGNVAGFTVGFAFVVYAGSTPNRFLVSYTGVGGYSVDVNGAGTTLRFVVYNSAGGTVVLSITLNVGDIGRERWCTFVHTGSALIVYLDGVQAGTVACAGYKAADPAGRFSFGAFISSTGEQTQILGASGADLVIATQADATALEADFRANRRIPKLATFAHLWDFTLDAEVAADGIAPPQILDRIGTDHMSLVGIAVRTGPNAIRGVGPYSAADYFSTIASLTSGIRGSNTFHAVADIVLTRLTTVGEAVLGCANAALTRGWFINYYLNGAVPSLRVICNGVQLGRDLTITAGMLGTRLRCVVNKTASTLEFWVNGVLIGGSGVAAASYVAPTAADSFTIGAAGGGTAPFLSGIVELVQGGDFVLTAGEIAALNADLTLAAPVVAGKTPKRYPLEADIAAASGQLPSRSVERVSSADADVLMRQGAPVLLAARTERLFGYEKDPILYAGDTFSDTAYWGCPTSDVGAAAGFTLGAVFRLLSLTVSGTVIDMGETGAAPGTTGAQLRLLSGGCYFYARGASGVSSPVYTFQAADVGKTFAWMGVHDGVKIRNYIKRIEQSTGTTISGFTNGPAQPSTFGRHGHSAGLAASGIQLLGVIMGNQVVTLAEYQAWWDACLAADGVVQAVPGKPMFRYRMPANGVLPASLAPMDGVGPIYTTQGSPALVPQYARAWAA